MDVNVMLRDGQLDEAIAALGEGLRSNPTDREGRGLLFELLVLAGEYDRADKQLGVLEKQHPDAAPSVALYRQLVRASQWRDDVFESGRVPAFLVDPDERMRTALAGLTALRAGDAGAAADAFATVEGQRAAVAGRSGDVGFDDWRDADDRLGGVFELMTSTGKYYWVAPEAVRSIRFEGRERPRDLAWRQAEVEVVDGPNGVVYVPAVYPGAAGMTTPQKLARETDWAGAEGEPVQGVGQRMWLIGDEGVPVHQLTTLEFETAEA